MCIGLCLFQPLFFIIIIILALSKVSSIHSFYCAFIGFFSKIFWLMFFFSFFFLVICDCISNSFFVHIIVVVKSTWRKKTREISKMCVFFFFFFWRCLRGWYHPNWPFFLSQFGSPLALSSGGMFSVMRTFFFLQYRYIFLRTGETGGNDQSLVYLRVGIFERVLLLGHVSPGFMYLLLLWTLQGGVYVKNDSQHVGSDKACTGWNLS